MDQNNALMDEGRYKLLVDAVTDYALYMLDVNGYVHSWNPGAKRFKGYEPAEIIGAHFSRFYTEQDRQRKLPQHALDTAAREGRFEGEGWRVRKDGTHFWANVVIDPIRDDAGTLIGFAKITRDLTERRQAEEAIRQSEQRFTLLVQSVVDYGIYMLDVDGHVTNWNAGAERIKGYSQHEAIGQHFSLFYTDEDRSAGEPEQGLEIARRDGRMEKEGWRVRKDGSRFWANVIIDTIRNEQGVLIGFAKVTRDVTEKRAAQRALEQAREALFQSQKMEALGQLTGGIAHDFNNLLMVIMSSLQLVRKRSSDDSRAIQLLDNAIQGAQRGASLTQRMLAFARRQSLTPEAIDIPDLIRGMADLLQRSLGAAIVIETHFPLKLSLVHADVNQLELALMNLATNARDAMPDGGSVTISAQAVTVAGIQEKGLEAGNYVRICVADTGAGMDKATLAHAMEPFFTTKGIGKGTGLGLSMVHGMAEQSGGKLSISSEPGTGTTAEIWLPVAKAGHTVQPRAIAPAMSPAGETKALNILLVDDDPLVLIGTAALLEDIGHNVLTAASGADALAVLQSRNDVHLVVTDHAMPQMTGSQLAAAIGLAWPDLPVILASGFAELPANADSTLPRLSKPFGQQALQDMLILHGPRDDQLHEVR